MHNMAQGASAATKRGAPICYDFVKGMCTRGTECRYSHDIASVIHSTKTRPIADSSTADEPCFDFLRWAAVLSTACWQLEGTKMVDLMSSRPISCC